MTTNRRELLGKVHTKIVATIGPASREPATLCELIEAGVDVFRLNFSHGTHDEHTETLRRVRQAADDCGRIVAVLQDLGGPKIRLGTIPGDAVECHLGDDFTLVKDRTCDDPHELTCTYRDLPDDLRTNDIIYYADGAVAMVVTGKTGAAVQMRVTLAGRVRSQQGLNLPGAALNVKALTEKDLRDLDWTASHEIDYVGLSFVRQASDVIQLRRELEARKCRAKIIAKIEKPQAADNLDSIIAEADGVMVARGDLGVEVDVARVPAIQKQVIAACHQARIPVITATQMLNSMETSNRPTRAEATDVFNAVLDGTDAVMLSGETAVGLFPIDAVSTMSRIASEAESLMLENPAPTQTANRMRPLGPGRGRAGWVQPVTESLVEAVRTVTRRLGASLVVVSTNSGRTALALSKQRYGTPTLALASDKFVARAMALYWGVTPVTVPEVTQAAKTHEFAMDWARSHGLVSTGDYVVVVEGTMPDNPSHNTMTVEVVH